MSQSNRLIVKVKRGDDLIYYSYDQKKVMFHEVTEGYLNGIIPGFRRLNKAARRKEFKKFVSEGTVIATVCLPDILANSKFKIDDHTGDKHKPRLQDLQIGLTVLLQMADLFEQPEAGFLLISSILAGLHSKALRYYESGFRTCLSIGRQDETLVHIIKVFVDAVVPLNKWTGKWCKVKRKSVLNYRNSDDAIGRHIQDFSFAKIKVDHVEHDYPDIIIPVAYEDTVVTVIGASSSQLREALPYLENACAILINCGSSDLEPDKLSLEAISAYNPSILELLVQYRNEVSAVFRFWWEECDDQWAKGIVTEARASFEKPASNYIAVTLNPKTLRKKILHLVLSSFFDTVESLGWITNEDLEKYRQGAENVFDPAPIIKPPQRYMEDPAVFLELMGQILREQHDKILQENEPFVKTRKPFAAYRSISNERHLVILESDFKKAYAKTARNAKNLDTTFLQKDNWVGDLQKRLAEAGVIKSPNTGYRYRYDLLQNGSRDTTYVVAIPCDKLENDSANLKATDL